MDKSSLPRTLKILKKTSGSALTLNHSAMRESSVAGADGGIFKSGTNTTMARVIKLLLCVLVAVTAHMLVWRKFERTVYAPEITGRVASLSYMPGRNLRSGEKPGVVTPEQIDRDLSVLANSTDSIRTYNATRGMEALPAIAAKYGLSVTLGIWVEKDPVSTRKEIEAAIAAAKRYPNIRGLIVGNEALLRKEVSVDQLIALLREVRARTMLPVTTAEPWHVWLQYPKLASEVDYISAHILPYWEGLPPEQAVPYAEQIHDRLQETFPDKNIVIAEFGWPSGGYNRGAAVTGRIEEGSILRYFISTARRRGIDYNLVEAFDQPWKTNEGSVGTYWGMFDADGHAKFALTGPLQSNNSNAMHLALILGGLFCLFILALRRFTFAQGLALALAANAAGAVLALVLTYPAEAYMTIGESVFYGIGLALLMPLLVLSLLRFAELAEVLWGDDPGRLIRPRRRTEQTEISGRLPKVSIHLPACRESPDVVKASLNSLARLDYPDFEVLVVINNTPEERLWRPVEAHCQALGERFRFINLPKVSGFKAGALNEALRLTDPQAEIVAIIDADYRVSPDWLADLVPAFADAKVAMVQAPQDHDEGGVSLSQRMMNAEYAGFFDIGMVQRNEDNAIITHGTMLLIRKQAMLDVGGWATDTIVEDTELGLRIFRNGGVAHYTNRRYGQGVLPDSVAAYCTQRQRWAYGAMQILRKHWKAFLPGGRDLSLRQKWHFATGWLNWIADAAGVGLAVLNLLAIPFMLFDLVAFPPMALLAPVFAAYALMVLHTVLLYRRRVDTTSARIVGAAISAMSLQLTIARAVFSGLIAQHLPFRRTDKGGMSKPGKLAQLAMPELLLGLLLLAGAATAYALNEFEVTEQNRFALLMVLQSVPFLASTTMRLTEAFEASRLGELIPGWFAVLLRRPSHAFQ
jgi:exo-beta-1,3-glucanase (GH17 family)/cellulose synthase/poly-beta-1,6-N-acetylglucosamine synthase-like glycosyltransferase